MNDCDHLNICLEKFSIMFAKIDSLDSAIRGTPEGYPGVIGRLDRLEQASGKNNKLRWLLVCTIAGMISSSTVGILILILNVKAKG